MNEYEKFNKKLFESLKKSVPVADPRFLKFYEHNYGSKVHHLNFGDLFLYQVYSHHYKTLSYPKVATFIKYNIIDQALALEFVNAPRTLENNKKYYSNTTEGYMMPIGLNVAEVSEHYEWDDKIYIFGVWKFAPSINELAKAYRKTIWYSKIKLIECETCDGKGEAYFSCCSGDVVHSDVPMCRSCGEHLGEDTCHVCEGAGFVEDGTPFADVAPDPIAQAEMMMDDKKYES